MSSRVRIRYRAISCLCSAWSVALAALAVPAVEARAGHVHEDTVEFVQTGVFLDSAPPLELNDSQPVTDEASAAGSKHDVIIDWNLGAFTLRRWTDEESDDAGEPVAQKDAMPHEDMQRLHTSGRIAQMMPVVMIFMIVLFNLNAMCRSRRAQIDVRKVGELAMACALFLFSGPAVIILNKRIMATHDFHFPILLASLGQCLLMVLVRPSVSLGWMQLETKTMTWGRYIRVVLLLKVFNLGSQVCGMWAYMFVSVPEVEALKSITVALTMALAAAFAKERVNAAVIISVLVIVAGTAVSAIFDKDDIPTIKNQARAHVFGLLLCILACAFEASKVVVSQILMDSMTVFDGIYWSAPAFVMLATVLVLAIELPGLTRYHFTGELICMLLLNAILTSFTVLANFWFVKLVGALSLKVIAQARTVGLILISVFFFHEHCNAMTYVGYAVSLLGVGMFNHAKAGQLPPMESPKGMDMITKEASFTDMPLNTPEGRRATWKVKN